MYYVIYIYILHNMYIYIYIHTCITYNIYVYICIIYHETVSGRPAKNKTSTAQPTSVPFAEPPDSLTSTEAALGAASPKSKATVSRSMARLSRSEGMMGNWWTSCRCDWNDRLWPYRIFGDTMSVCVCVCVSVHTLPSWAFSCLFHWWHSALLFLRSQKITKE